MIFRNYNYVISYNKGNPLYTKNFDYQFKINDFIELYFKIRLKYSNINDIIYLKSIYQIKNDNIVLYTSVINHNKYSFFDDYLTINETIFYTFSKDIDNINFIINFETIKNDIQDIEYIFNNNDRLVFKHYST